jgi:hypothetical protein
MPFYFILKIVKIVKIEFENKYYMLFLKKDVVNVLETKILVLFTSLINMFLIDMDLFHKTKNKNKKIKEEVTYIYVYVDVLLLYK